MMSETAYARGGAPAAAKALREVTADQPPEVVAAINAAARPTVDKIITDLASGSKEADGAQADQGQKQRAFDQTVADLSLSLSRGATTPAGKAELDHAAQSITAAITRDGVGRFDEALGNSALGGPNYGNFNGDGLTNLDGMASADTGLAIAVMGQLNTAGKTSEADDILQNVNASTNCARRSATELPSRWWASRASARRASSGRCVTVFHCPASASPTARTPRWAAATSPGSFAWR